MILFGTSGALSDPSLGHFDQIIIIIRNNLIIFQTDAVTLHGLDSGDRQALLSLFGDKVATKVNQGVTSMVVKEVEHMNVSLTQQPEKNNRKIRD